MTLSKIKEAVLCGHTVYWDNEGYTVVHDSLGQWLVCFHTGDCTGLTWLDGETMNYDLNKFYIKGY